MGTQVVSDVETHIQGFSNYIHSLQRSPRTAHEYIKVIRQWASWWAKPLDRFDTDAWDQWLYHLTERGTKGTTIRMYQSAVSKFFKYLRRRKVVTHDPRQDAESVGIIKRIPEFLTEEQITNMYAACRDARDSALLECLYAGGLRNAELRSLMPQDITPAALRVTGKGRKERIVALTPKSYSVIIAYVQGRKGCSYAFGRLKGNRMALMTVGAIVRRLAQSAGVLQRVTPHTLRHSIATHLAIRGTSPQAIQRFLGHASIETTMIYVHIADSILASNVLAHHPRS